MDLKGRRKSKNVVDVRGKKLLHPPGYLQKKVDEFNSREIPKEVSSKMNRARQADKAGRSSYLTKSERMARQKPTTSDRIDTIINGPGGILTGSTARTRKLGTSPQRSLTGRKKNRLR